MKKLLFLLFLFTTFQAFGNIYNWNVIKKDNFSVFYPNGYEERAKEALYFLIETEKEVQKISGNYKKRDVKVVLEDAGIYANGYADPLNYKISFFLSGLSIKFYNYNWLKELAIHEHTHISQMNNYSGLGAVLPIIYGNVYSPNVHMPLWMIEGAAVYNESNHNEYAGRLNDGYLDKVISQKVLNDDFPDIMKANYNYNGFPLGNYYYYGGAFFRFLSEKYGEEKFAHFFKLNGKNPLSIVIGNFIPYIGIDRSARKVYGKNFNTLFEEWKDYEKEKAENILIYGERVSIKKENINYSYMIEDNKKLYYFKSQYLNNTPFSFSYINQLVEYDIEKEKEKVLYSATANSYEKIIKLDNKIYFAQKETDRFFPNISNNKFGLNGIIYCIDLKTNKKKKIYKDNFSDFYIDEKNIYIIEEDKKSLSTKIKIIDKLNIEKQEINYIDERAIEIIVIDEEIYISSKKNIGPFNLKKFDKKNGNLISLIDSPWPHYYLKKTEDNKIIYTSNIDKKVALFEYDTLEKTLNRITLNDYARDGINVKNEVYYISLNEKGEEIRKETKNIDIIEINLPKEEYNLELKNFEFEKKNIYWENLKSALIPSSREISIKKDNSINIFGSGQDALAMNSYEIEILANNYLILEMNLGILAPLNLYLKEELDLKKMTHKSIETGMAYPIYVSNKNGIKNISIFGDSDFKKDNNLGLSLKISYPKNNFNFYYSERVGEKKEIYETGMSYLYSFHNGNIYLNSIYYNNESPDSDFLRGYDIDEDIEMDGEVLFTKLEFNHKIFKFRKGIYNPNIYINDIFGKLFIENVNSLENKTAYGMELLFEVSTGYQWSFTYVLGAVFNENEEKFYNGAKIGW